MKHKKNIDHLYREKFKNVETTPPEAAWKNISSRLPQKEPKRRILPLWYKLAGVAAILAVLFSLSHNLLNRYPEASSTEVTISQEDIGIDVNGGSIEFNQIMTESSRMLKDILENSRELNRKEFLVSEKTIPRSTENTFAGIITEPDKLSLSQSSPDLFSYPDLTSENPVQPKKDPVATLEEPSLFPNEEKISSEEAVAAETAVKRLRISTKVAPVFYDQLGTGSSLDKQFSANQGAGEISLSYGVNLAYQISKKLKIRSGISKVDLNYQTKDIPLVAAASAAALGGKSEERKITTLASPISGSINQRLGFIEVPLEIEYALINKKIGLNFIGGGSTLFLNDNMISLESPNHSTNLGEANNLNNVSFSTNIGLGIDYNISSQFQLNFEPMFKFQMNTFDNAPNVNPYYFGVFSGFSFKF